MEAFEEPLDRNTAGETPRSQRVLKTSAQARPRRGARRSRAFPRRRETQNPFPDGKRRELLKARPGNAKRSSKKAEAPALKPLTKAPFFNAEGGRLKIARPSGGDEANRQLLQKMSKRTYGASVLIKQVSFLTVPIAFCFSDTLYFFVASADQTGMSNARRRAPL